MDATCARCGHVAGGCQRCGQTHIILGATADGKRYCHTFKISASRSCYEEALWERTVARMNESEVREYETVKDARRAQNEPDPS